MSIVIGDSGLALPPIRSGRVAEALSQMELQANIYLTRPFLLDLEGRAVSKECVHSSLPEETLLVFDESAAAPVPPRLRSDRPEEAKKFVDSVTSRVRNLARCHRAAQLHQQALLRDGDLNSKFLESVQQFNELQHAELATFEKDIAALENISLERSLQRTGCRTMYDVIPEQKLKDFRAEFQEELGGLVDVLSSVPVLDGQGKEQATIEEMAEQAQQLSLTVTDENAIKQATKAAQLLETAQRQVYTLLQRVYQLMGLSKQAKQYQGLFKSLQQRYQFLLYPKEAPRAYAEGLKEIARRSAFETWFIQQLHDANKWVRTTFHQEEHARRDFLEAYGKRIPLDLAPSLRESPPDWSIQWPEFQRLPEVSASSEPARITYAPLVGDDSKLEAAKVASAQLRQKVAELEQQEAAARVAVAQLEKEKAVVLKEKEALQQANEDLLQHSRISQHVAEERDKLKASFLQNETQVDQLTRELTSVRDALRVAQEAHTQSQAEATAQHAAALAEVQQQLAASKAQLASGSSSAAETEAKLAVLQQELSSAQSAAKAAAEREDKVNTQLVQAQETARKQEAALGALKVEVEGKVDMVSEVRQKLAAEQKRAAAAEEKAKQAEADLARAQECLAGLEGASSSQVEVLQTQMAALEEKYNAEAAQTRALQRGSADFQRKEVALQAEIQRLQTQLDREKSHIHYLTQQLENRRQEMLNTSGTQYQQRNQDYQRLCLEYERVQHQWELAKGEKLSVESRVSELEAQLQGCLGAADELRKLKNHHSEILEALKDERTSSQQIYEEYNMLKQRLAEVEVEGKRQLEACIQKLSVRPQAGVLDLFSAVSLLWSFISTGTPEVGQIVLCMPEKTGSFIILTVDCQQYHALVDRECKLKNQPFLGRVVFADDQKKFSFWVTALTQADLQK